MANWLREVSVGQWFASDMVQFEIVGVDPDAELVLVQHYDGSLEELDFEQWLALDVEECAAPEDYSGALDLEPEDYPERAAPGTFHPPLDGLERWDPETLN